MAHFIREIGLASYFNATKLVLLIFLLLGGCETSQKIIPTDRPGEADSVSILTGKAGGIKFSDYTNENLYSGSLPVNALLWRAALDIASFVPLDDVDTFGGSIVTEWHQSEGSLDQRLKLTIFVIGLELRSDAIKVNSYLQKKRNGNWVDAGRDEVLSRKLEDLILTRARELRSSAISKKTK